MTHLIKSGEPFSRTRIDHNLSAKGLRGRPDFTVYNRSGQIKRVYEIKSGNARLSPAQKSNQIKLKSNFKLVRWF